MNVIMCDRCGKPIPIETVDVLGNSVPVLKCGKVQCKQWDFSNLFARFDLCVDCAKIIGLELDNKLLEMRNEILEGK